MTPPKVPGPRRTEYIGPVVAALLVLALGVWLVVRATGRPARTSDPPRYTLPMAGEEPRKPDRAPPR